MLTLLRYRLKGRQICQPTSFKPNEVRQRMSIGSLLIIIFLLVPLGGCASLDDLASGESWFSAEPLATEVVRYTRPTLMSPLAREEISTSDLAFKPFDFSLTLESNLPQEQMDLHKANLISLLTNKVSRGSIAPWEGSIELGQQNPTTSMWMASLEAKYEPNQQFEADSYFVPMGTLAMAWIDDEVGTNSDAIENENHTSVASSIVDLSQKPLGLSSRVIASASGSYLAWDEIISTSLRWLAILFLVVVLLIPAGCSYAARIIGTQSRSSPMTGRRRSDDPKANAISRAISNIATR